MTDLSDDARRLHSLERILAQSKPAAEGLVDPEADAVALHLRSVPVERLRQLTTELAHGSAGQPDPVDALVMRVLLNEYSAAVAHLRAVATITSQRVAGASVRIRRAARFIARRRDASLRSSADE